MLNEVASNTAAGVHATALLDDEARNISSELLELKKKAQLEKDYIAAGSYFKCGAEFDWEPLGRAKPRIESICINDSILSLSGPAFPLNLVLKRTNHISPS